jgi:hypothetical protein
MVYNPAGQLTCRVFILFDLVFYCPVGNFQGFAQPGRIFTARLGHFRPAGL